jgi:hypothetical protein
MLLRVAQSWNMMTPITKGIRKVQCERAGQGMILAQWSNWESSAFLTARIFFLEGKMAGDAAE